MSSQNHLDGLRRAGSGTSGPAQRRRKSVRAFAVVALMGLASSLLYANSVNRDQPGASALTGDLRVTDDEASAVAG